MRRRTGRPGLLGTAARTAVVVGTANAMTAKSQQRAAGAAAQQELAMQQAAQQAAAQQAAAQQAALQQPAPVAAPAAPAVSAEDRISQLKALADLRAQGILTDAEFEVEKARILA